MNMQAPIAVFFALEAESGCFEDRLKHTEHLHAAGFRAVLGTLHEVPFLAVQTGTGMKNAHEVAWTVCQTHNPRMVISAGFSGALTPSLKKHDLIFPSEILRDSAEPFFITSTLSRGILPENSQLGGRVLTVDRVITQPKTKQELGVKFQAQVVEMESYAIAEVARLLDLPFLSIRVISDSADEALPPDVQKLVKQKTTASRVGAAFGMLFQRPSSVKDLFGLYQGSITSSSRLADGLEAIAQSDLLRFLSENFQPPREKMKQLEAHESSLRHTD